MSKDGGSAGGKGMNGGLNAPGMSKDKGGKGMNGGLNAPGM